MGHKQNPKPRIWKRNYKGGEGSDGMGDRFNKGEDTLSECNI